MTAPLNSNIRIISYNCRGWNSASNFVSNLMDDCDICLIQEHWLFKEQLQNLNISDEFSSIAVSGMVTSEFVAGRPYGGCAILSLSSVIKTIKTTCKILCNFTYLLLNVDPSSVCLSTY